MNGDGSENLTGGNLKDERSLNNNGRGSNDGEGHGHS